MKRTADFHYGLAKALMLSTLKELEQMISCLDTRCNRCYRTMVYKGDPNQFLLLMLDPTIREHERVLVQCPQCSSEQQVEIQGPYTSRQTRVRVRRSR